MLTFIWKVFRRGRWCKRSKNTQELTELTQTLNSRKEESHHKRDHYPSIDVSSSRQWASSHTWNTEHTSSSALRGFRSSENQRRWAWMCSDLGAAHDMDAYEFLWGCSHFEPLTKCICITNWKWAFTWDPAGPRMLCMIVIHVVNITCSWWLLNKSTCGTKRSNTAQNTKLLFFGVATDVFPHIICLNTITYWRIRYMDSVVFLERWSNLIYY